MTGTRRVVLIATLALAGLAAGVIVVCDYDASRAAPAVSSAGQLDIEQTWTVDLDEGSKGASPEVDIWFQAVTPTERYLTPVKGALLTRVGLTAIGPNGCETTPLSSKRIDLKDLSAGTYLLVRTNRGRCSEVRVVAAATPHPGVLKISWVTWQAGWGSRLRQRVASLAGIR